MSITSSISLQVTLTKNTFFCFREALNLAESPPHIPNIKRERDLSSDYHDRERDIPSQPPPKRVVPIDKSLQRNHSVSMHNDERSRTPVNEHDEPRHASSPIRNGISHTSSSGGPTTVLSGMQFKITSRGKFNWFLMFGEKQFTF